MVKETSPRTADLRIGEMPRAQYLPKIPSPFPDTDKVIGIMAFSSKTRELKPFLWWDNIQIDLRDENNRGAIVGYLARIILDLDTDVVVGPAISLSKCNPQAGEVELVDSWPAIGIYVEPTKRLGFSSKVESLSSLKRFNFPKDGIVLVRVKSVLPHP